MSNSPAETRLTYIDATTRLLVFFTSEHLPSPLREISTLCEELAYVMVERLPQCAELAVGRRKLLEAKDCFVRAKLPLNRE